MMVMVVVKMMMIEGIKIKTCIMMVMMMMMKNMLNTQSVIERECVCEGKNARRTIDNNRCSF